jgi:energy-coupling factor transporter ATP-binding protein EcfA2
MNTTPNQPVMIIGLSGRMKSGKDTVLKLMRELLDHKSYTIVRQSFADALKLEVAEACGVSLNFLEEHKDNFRLILQGWGTDFRRNLYSKEYWISKWMERYSLYNWGPKNILVATDVRFLNEQACLKDLGGIIVRIARDEDKRSEYAHQSETELDHYTPNYIIYNLTTLETLRCEVEVFLEKLKLL